MLSLENTASRMSHLARQEIYFDRHFGLDETLAGVERVTADDVQRVAQRSVRGRRAGRDGARARIAGADRERIDLAEGLKLDTNDSALHPPRDGRASGASSAATRPGSRSSSPPPTRWRRPASCPPTPRASCARRPRSTSPASKRSSRPRSTTSSRSPPRSPSSVGPAARWLHFGLTSSDVVDTAQALQMREACDLIVKDVDALMDAVRARAEEHRRTPMIGRTHGVHAEPMTFGLKLALWYAELQRDLDRVLRARDVVVGRQDLRRGRHVRAPRSRRSKRASASGSGCSRRRCRRRSSSATGTPS